MGYQEQAIRTIVKNPYEHFNSRSLSKIIGISHAGMFKILKKLEQDKILISKLIGRARIYSLNFENDLAVKKAVWSLSLEGYSNMRWIEEFRFLKEFDGFIILFGSILTNPGEARDIDLLIVQNKKELNQIKKYVSDKNKIMTKRVHALLQTKEDFLNDFKKRNKVILEAIKTGRVLFGQEKFINLLKENESFRK